MSLLALLAALAGSLPGSEAQLKPLRSKSIPEGFAWLARHQNPDGSWGAKSLEQVCSAAKPCYSGLTLDGHYDTGLTGLALLAFLRSGFEPASTKEIVDPLTNKKYVAGELVTRGLAWLKKRQREGGGFAHEDDRGVYLYGHAIAELAVIEAWKLSHDEGWKACAQAGVACLEESELRDASGEHAWGWRYWSRKELERAKAKKEAYSEADTSATGWAIAALSSADRSGLEVHTEAFAGGLAFLNSVCLANGLVGYDTPGNAGLTVQGRDDALFDYHVGTLCALGILTRLQSTKERTNTFYEVASKHLLEDLPALNEGRRSIDYYYWYHGTEALNALEGTEYAKGKKRKLVEPWNKAVSDTLLALQDHTKGACSFGGWVARDRWAYAGGPVYCTAMALLSLQTSARK